MLSIAVPAFLNGLSVQLSEIGWSGFLALLSIAGQLAMTVALAETVPQSVVFLTVGDSILIVLIGTRLLFGARMNGLTKAMLRLGFFWSCF